MAVGSVVMHDFHLFRLDSLVDEIVVRRRIS